MLIAILVRNLLETIYENKRLFETIKNILNALPEGVVIECTEADEDTVVIKYANSVAKTRLFKEDPDDQPINQINLSSKIVGANFEGIADNFQINVQLFKSSFDNVIILLSYILMIIIIFNINSLKESTKSKAYS